jgi:DNA-binding LacI/PurR family transcriptional regulator
MCIRMAGEQKASGHFPSAAGKRNSPVAPMSSSRPPSLIAHTVEVLRDGLLRGVWRDRLPGERELSASLQVSRPTLRAALSVLEKEGWIQVRQGAQRVIVGRLNSVGGREGPKVVAILSGEPLREIVPNSQVWTDRLHEWMAKGGYEIQMHCGRRWFGRHPERDLERLTTHSPAAVWLLFVSTPSMQRWFERSGQRAVVSGSLHPGIDLASVDFDHRATCRHAAGKLVSAGHRRLVLVRQSEAIAGDAESEAGFREGAVGVEGAAVSVAQHDGSPEGIRRMIQSLMRRSPRPTGFLVARANVALAVASELIRLGIGVPEEASIISRDSDRFLEYFSPSLARYGLDPNFHARTLSRLLLRVAEGATVSQRKVRMLPEFLGGESFGSVGGRRRRGSG